MSRLILWFFCCLIANFIFSEEELEELSLSTPDQVATLISEPSYLIGGIISPLSGQPSLKQTDLLVKGAQSIVLKRIYIPPYIPCIFPRHRSNQEEWDKKYLFDHLLKNYKGWVFFPHLRLQFTPRRMEVRLTDPSGMTFDFRIGKKTTLISSHDALSNTMGDIPSGKYDPRNTLIFLEENGSKITVNAADGTIRVYNKVGKNGEITTSHYFFILEEEILPNGKVLKYHYNDKYQLVRIDSLDPKSRYVYASLNLSEASAEGYHFVSSSGMKADYFYENRSLHMKIKEKNKGMHVELEGDFSCPPILTRVSSPFFRHETVGYSNLFLLNSYCGKHDIFKMDYVKGSHYKISSLSVPVGFQDAFQPIYKITYNPPLAGAKEGSTTVEGLDGTSTVYHFSKNLLLKSIQYFQYNVLKKEKNFSWDDKNWLTGIEMRDGQNNLLYKRSYEYDSFGNPTLETFTGNLTGEGFVESHSIKKQFSQDGRQLLLKEEDEDGKILSFTYLPKTNLLTSKLTQDRQKILIREFYEYDDCNNLIQKIIDDGVSEDKNDLTNVTQRTITNTILRQQAPFLHMPEWIEEKYLEEGREKWLRRVHLVYDNHGNIAHEEIYDANDHLAYTIDKEYNEQGEVLSETNPSGQKALYSYDPKGHLCEKTHFSKRRKETMHYDTKGRLKEQSVKGNDGLVHTTQYRYDFYDHQIETIDPFQLSTHYEYDSLVNQVIKTDFPPVASVEQQPIPVDTHFEYDSLGREIMKTDANGHTTFTHYNAYGSPIEKTYSDGSKEQYRYEKNGRLASYTDRDGLMISYQYDTLGKILRKTYISAEEENLANEFFAYSAFNLMKETDREGHESQYFYDGAGRKIKETVCGRATEFAYDPLGRLQTIRKGSGDNSLYIHYTWDLEDSLIEESKEDSLGNLLYKNIYSYDEDGNRATRTRLINGNEAIETFGYDSFQRLTEQRDPYSNLTRTIYDENNINALGQKVLQTTRTDPKNTSYIETYDAHGHLVRSEATNSQKATLSKQDMTYDPVGNLIWQKDDVYENGNFKDTQTIRFTRTADNQVDTLTRAFGTTNARTLAYTYTPAGKMRTKTLSDGTTLSYHYHPLGHLNALNSSDGKIQHTFQNNRLGHLISAKDEKANITIWRENDPFGNVVREVFPNGFEIKRTYDEFNRPTRITLAEQEEVHYTYDPLFLRKVERLSKGKVLYAHEYEDYDLSGHLVSEKTGCFKITHQTDLNRRRTLLSSPCFVQESSYDTVGNLIQNVIDGTPTDYSYDDLSQLTIEKGPNDTLTYAYDSLYNRTKKNETTFEVNALNEVLLPDQAQSFDINGNQILKKTPNGTFHLIYDPLNRLTDAISEKSKVSFIYDPLGRCLSKTISHKTTKDWKEADREYYLYDRQNEIGAFSAPNRPKNLRVLGIADHPNDPKTIGIEIKGKVFIPILDIQGNIRRLIDLNSKKVKNDEFTAFGEELGESEGLNPWRFASKRFDPDLGLIYFGKRYYDPEFARWLTTDPVGIIDDSNLYHYLYNNPFRYVDPDGQFVFALPFIILFEFALPTLTIALPTMTQIGMMAGLAIAATAGYEIAKKANEWDQRSIDYPMPSQAVEESPQTEAGKKKKKPVGYAPDRPLPQVDGKPVPDAEVPHTQLGTRNGSKGKYRKAREFDGLGLPVRDIEFTDHGRPYDHTNPHQHRREENITGGTHARRKQEPLPEWDYQ